MFRAVGGDVHARRLDARRAVPAAAAVVGVGVGGSAATDPEEPDKGGCEPDDGRQEAEGNVCLVATARITAGADVAPVKDGAAAITDEIDEQTKGDEPEDAEEDVHGPVDEAAGEGEQPDQGEQQRQAGHDDGVDEAAIVPGRRVGGVEVGAGNTSDDGSERQLGTAEDKLHNTVERHCESVCACVSLRTFGLWVWK